MNQGSVNPGSMNQTSSLAHTIAGRALKCAVVALLAGSAALSGGCNNAGEGGLSGAALGAGAGAIIGSLYGDFGKGAAIGAVAGGLGGAVIGDQNARRGYSDYNSRDRVAYSQPAYSTYEYRSYSAPTYYYYSAPSCQPYATVEYRYCR